MSSTHISINMHIIFATKGRAPMIVDAWRNDLHAYIGGTVRGLGAQALAVGGVADHVHLLAGIKATHSVAELVRQVKWASSVWAKERYQPFAWQAGYAAFSISQPDANAVARYVATQEEHHKKLSSAEELRGLLAEFGVAYEEQYFE